jgi:opacity protein-like surface antigen
VGVRPSPVVEAWIEMKMKRAFAPLLAAIAGATLSLAAPVLAGGMNDEAGPLKTHTYPSVPVPAPIPVPETFQWYVRADAGYALRSSGSIDVSGPIVSRVTDYADQQIYSGSLGFGRYITPSLRIEGQLNIRNEAQVVRDGASSYTRDTFTDGPDVVVGVNVVPSTYRNTYDMVRGESAKLGHYSLMLNGYYDIKTGTAFTPYVGAGAGIALGVFKYRFTDTGTCIQSEQIPDPAGLNPIVGCAAGVDRELSATGGFVKNNFAPALALMTGFSYDLGSGVLLDAGYRLMWMGTTPQISMVDPAGGSNVLSFGSRIDHELHVGVRWNIW